MGDGFVGPDELKSLSFMQGRTFETPALSFTEESIRAHAATHLLIFTPAIKELTIDQFREEFGVDPAHEPCMYNQDWYLKEDFASKALLDGAWHLIRKEVLSDARAKRPEEIEISLSHEQFSSAVTYTFTFFAWWLLRKEILWKHDFLWCSDRDHNGDRIYVGRYEDPAGVNKNGFNIHRHLALRPSYSAAPEIV